MQEKETALNMAVDTFCRLIKQQSDVAQLINKYEVFSHYSDWTIKKIHISYIHYMCSLQVIKILIIFVSILLEIHF